MIDEALIEEFAELEAVQFDHCNPYYKDRVWGLFGEQDTLAHFSPLFLKHYNQAFHFPGGHTPTEQEVKTWYAPLAQKMLMEFSAKEERYFQHFKSGKYNSSILPSTPRLRSAWWFIRLSMETKPIG